MEIIKSLLFIVYGILLHAYSKGLNSKLQRHVYNFFILAAIVWLVSFNYFPYWKIVVTLCFVFVNLYAVKTIIEKVKNGEFIEPPSWVFFVSAAVICAGMIIKPSSELTLITVVFAVFFLSMLLILEKLHKTREEQQKKISESRTTISNLLNDREKIVERIKKENIILEQSKSPSSNVYTYYSEVNNADNTVLRRYIIEPLFPETSINRQAHYLAHELGHYYDSIERKPFIHRFIIDCRKARRLKPICGLFVLYDEWSAWKRAELICLEEGVDIRFFRFSRKNAISTYVKDCCESVLKPLKTLIATYLFSVGLVVLSVLLTDTGIHLPFGLDTLTSYISKEPNRTGLVNFIFYNIMIIRFVIWLHGLFFSKSKTDYQYVPEGGFVSAGKSQRD
ncbi:hypothetical protein M3596_22305 [Bacillus subtilis]|uniref:hypothetical protein n=1 Tax=Bacillus subtilis TaxID=1423 RepID=UPI00203E91FD|nr:hypothetical protein [Bacillus subtilis]MCM3191445.1 hypothetical protein [Bacillus subtilis]